MRNVILPVIVTHKWLALEFQFELHANGWLTWSLQIMTTARTDDHKSNRAPHSTVVQLQTYTGTFKCHIPHGAHYFIVKAAGFINTI